MQETPDETVVEQTEQEPAKVPEVQEKGIDPRSVAAAPACIGEAGMVCRTNKKRKDGPPEISDLSQWQQQAFWMLYTRTETRIGIGTIAARVGVGRETVSRFYNSKAYRRLAKDISAKGFERLVPLAQKQLERALMDMKAPLREVLPLALNVVKEAGVLEALQEKVKMLRDSTAPMLGQNVQINQFIGTDGEMNLESIRRAKAGLVEQVEAVIGKVKGGRGAAKKAAGGHTEN